MTTNDPDRGSTRDRDERAAEGGDAAVFDPLMPEPKPSADLADPARDLVPSFPWHPLGMGLVLFASAPGALRSAWWLARDEIEHAAVSFPSADGRPEVVVRLTRRRPDGGFETAAEEGLGLGVRTGSGEAGFHIPGDHGYYRAELGLRNQSGGWLMLSRSNGLHNAAGMGVQLSGLPRAPSVVSPLAVTGAAPRPVPDDAHRDTGLVPDGVLATVDRSPSSESVETSVSPPSVRSPDRATRASPETWATAGSMPSQRARVLSAHPIEPALVRAESALDAPLLSAAPREFPLAPVSGTPLPSTSGEAADARGTTPALPAFAAYPQMLPPLASEPTWSAKVQTAIQSALTQEVGRRHGEASGVAARSEDVRRAGTDPVLGSPSVRRQIEPLHYGVAPTRPNEVELTAQLRINGRAPAGAVIDLFGFVYRVGPGGGFQLQLPVDDPELIARALAAHPPRELERQQDD